MTTPTTMRPMTIGDLLDSAFRLYRKHFLTFIGIVALLQIPLFIGTTLIQFVFFGGAMADILGLASQPSPVPGGAPVTDPFALFPVMSYITVIGSSLVLGLIQYLVVYNLITGALARATARSFVGQEVSILDSYRIGWRAFFSLVVASLLPYLATIAVTALIVGCAVGAGFASVGLATGGFDNTLMTVGAVVAALGVFALVAAFIVGTIVLYVRFLFATQAIVLEGQGPISALGRSWRLSRGNFWRTLLLIFLMGILSYLISGLPASGVNLAVTFSMRSTEALLLGSFVTTLVANLGLILALPLQFCVYTLLYYDLRVRREGYDLELRVQQQATGSEQQAGVVG